MRRPGIYRVRNAVKNGGWPPDVWEQFPSANLTIIVCTRINQCQRHPPSLSLELDEPCLRRLVLYSNNFSTDSSDDDYLPPERRLWHIMKCNPTVWRLP
jgi:hypothetical protein